MTLRRSSSRPIRATRLGPDPSVMDPQLRPIQVTHGAVHAEVGP
jgi:hypothetical protein